MVKERGVMLFSYSSFVDFLQRFILDRTQKENAWSAQESIFRHEFHADHLTFVDHHLAECLMFKGKDLPSCFPSLAYVFEVVHREVNVRIGDLLLCSFALHVSARRTSVDFLRIDSDEITTVRRFFSYG